MFPKLSPSVYGTVIAICWISFYIQLADCTKVTIALRLAEDLCGQRAKFVETKELPPPSKSGPDKPCGKVAWNKCSEKGACKPFEKLPCDSGGSSSGGSAPSGPGNDAEKTGSAGADNGGASLHKPPNQKPSGGGKKDTNTGKFEPAINGTPYMVAIETANEDFSGWSLVGHGTIIDEVTIITSAAVVTNVGGGASAPHLFTYNGLRIVAGASNRSVTDNAQVVGVCCMSVYNDATTGDMDIGLMHLNKSLSMNEHVKKAELPPDGQTKPTECTYASWGKPKKATGSANYRKMAYEGTVGMVSSPDCESMQPNFFCTTPASCGMYDSGAPLMCTSGSNKVLYGISSQMSPSGDVGKCGDNSVFSSISVMDKEWIEKEKSSALKHCKRSK